MGFRTYLMSVPKSVWLEYKDKTQEELEQIEEGFYWKNLPDLVELYEIGKHWDFEECTTRFFTHEMDWESDMLFEVADKDFLKTIIENYRQKVVSYHTTLWETMKDISPKELREWKLKRLTNSKEIDESEFKINEIASYFREKIAEWNELCPYNLDDGNSEITSSWKYEYVIFELVRIYKTFDWENNLLIWCGH